MVLSGIKSALLELKFPAGHTVTETMCWCVFIFSFLDMSPQTYSKIQMKLVNIIQHKNGNNSVIFTDTELKFKVLVAERVTS